MQEKDKLDAVIDDHSHVPGDTDHSRNYPQRMVKRAETLGIKPPVSVRRYLDRTKGTRGRNGNLDKLSRDRFRGDYEDLTTQQKAEVDRMHDSLWDNAGNSEYLRTDKKRMTFGELHDIQLDVFRDENDKQYPQEMRDDLKDFRNGLEKDKQETAKKHGFYDAYSKADKALRIAVAGQHRATQNIPIQTARR